MTAKEAFLTTIEVFKNDALVIPGQGLRRDPEVFPYRRRRHRCCSRSRCWHRARDEREGSPGMDIMCTTATRKKRGEKEQRAH